MKSVCSSNEVLTLWKDFRSSAVPVRSKVRSLHLHGYLMLTRGTSQPLGRVTDTDTAPEIRGQERQEREASFICRYVIRSLESPRQSMKIYCREKEDAIKQCTTIKLVCRDQGPSPAQCQGDEATGCTTQWWSQQEQPLQKKMQQGMYRSCFRSFPSRNTEQMERNRVFGWEDLKQ
jgi:hypothetical protein